MKKLLMIILVMAVCVGFVYSASITITNPATGASMAKGSTVVITWNAVGTTNGFKLTLWKGGVLQNVIEPNFAAGNGNRTYSWTAPTICGNDYQIKIKEKTTAVADMTGNFIVTGCLTLYNPGALHVLKDLEIINLRYVLSRGGWIVASIKSNVNAFRGDVNFAVVFPEMRRDGISRITKNVNIARGALRDVYLYQKSSRTFSHSGLLTKVYVDYGNSISETKEDNNEMEKRLTVYDLYFTEGIRNSLVFKRMYGKKGRDYRVKFDMKVKNTHTRVLRNIKITCVIQEVGGPIIALRGLDVFGGYTIEQIGAGETYIKHFNFVFGKVGRRNANFPRIKQGKRYSIILQIDRDNEFAETNERNNHTSLIFGPVPR